MSESGFQVLRVLQPGGGALAVVRLISLGGRTAVLKDFSASPNYFRNSLGRYLTAREARAYVRLAGIRGVPRFLGSPRPDALLLEFVPGVNCREADGACLTHEFFRALSELLASVRSRGVAHCDVARNVVVGDDGAPCLVDFASSFVMPRWLGGVGVRLMRLRAPYDEHGIANLKRRYAPRLIAAGENDTTAKRLPLRRLVRVFERLAKATTRLAARAVDRSQG